MEIFLKKRHYDPEVNYEIGVCVKIYTYVKNRPLFYRSG